MSPQPSQIAPYGITNNLGERGMGAVYCPIDINAQPRHHNPGAGHASPPIHRPSRQSRPNREDLPVNPGHRGIMDHVCWLREGV